MPSALDAFLALTPEQRDLQLQLAEIHQSFARFVQFAWPILEPGRPLRWNWHIDRICMAVQRQVEWAEWTQKRQIAQGAWETAHPNEPYVEPAWTEYDKVVHSWAKYRRLAIFISPGDLKSVITSVLRPAWVWLRWPERRSLYFSHSKDVARRDSRRTRLVLAHPAYQWLVQCYASSGFMGCKSWAFEADQNEKHNFVNTQGGQRLCFGFDQNFTGERGDDVAIDDPVDAGVAIRADEGTLRLAFESANDIIANKMQSRVNDMKTATWTLTMQRLGEGDPGDIAIADGDWFILCFPKEFNPTHPLYLPEMDPRTVAGELINPAHDDRAELDRIKRKMGARHWSAQYGQLTGTSAGGLFPKSVFVAAPRYLDDPHALAASLDEVMISVDCTFKKSADSDRVALLVRGRKGWGRRYLLDRVCKRMTFSETIDELLRLHRLWHPAFVLVEDKANGSAVMDALIDAIPGLIPFNPGSSSKFERAQAGSSPLYAAHQQVLPDRTIAPWIDEFEHAHTAFTGGGQSTPDDDIDAESQSDLYWNEIARQSPWLSLPDLGPVAAPAWAQRAGWGRHYVHSTGTLSGEPTAFVVGVVPPAPTAPTMGHHGIAVIVSNLGDVVGHVLAPDPTTMASALVEVARSLSAMFSPGTRHPMAILRCRVACLVRNDSHAGERMASLLMQRDLPVIPDSQHQSSWWPSPGALAEAAQRGREMCGHGRLVVLDPLVHRTLTRAGLHPETGIPDVPRTQDGKVTYVGRPLAMDGVLLATLTALYVVGEERESEMHRQTRDAMQPMSYKQMRIKQLEDRYGERVTVAGHGSVWGANRPR